MPKKIAVVIRDRQEEALRMAVGVILMDDVIDVFVLDRPVEETEQNELNLETMNELDMKVYTNLKANDSLEYISSEEMARKLLEYDLVIPY